MHSRLKVNQESEPLPKVRVEAGQQGVSGEVYRDVGGG